MAGDRSRGGTALQIVLAMVLLAIIGGSAGYLAAERQKRHPSGVRAGATDPGAHPSGSTAPASPAGPEGTECPGYVEDQARIKPLHQLLYVRTTQSDVWICQDDLNRLYYQGHVGPRGEPMIEGVNSLFLTECSKDQSVPGGYVAVNLDSNGTARYFVSPEQLVKEIKGVRRPPEPVVTYQIG
jgi:hypothetical protein